MCQSPYMLGLSATPDDRDDSLDSVNHWGIGPILIAKKLQGYTEKSIPFKGKIIKVKYSGSNKYTKNLINEKLEMTSFTKMINQLTNDPHRLKMIVDLTIEQQKKGLNIYIFADRREYLELLRIELDKASVYNSIVTNDDELDQFQLKSIRLVGGSSMEEMNEAKSSKNVILSTYRYMSVGVSIPKMNCLILATPRRKKSEQTINRIFRLGSNYHIERVIINIVDIRTNLKKQWYMRKKYYEEKKYPIITKSVSFLDYTTKKK